MQSDLECLLIQQMEEVQAQHKNLQLNADIYRKYSVVGSIAFVFPIGTHRITDRYEIRLDIPDSYPDMPPIAFETGGKITQSFMHFMGRGNFCLEAPVEVRRRFSLHKNLCRFIDDQIIPYLATYSYKKEYGKPPFGERSHGVPGLLEYYAEFLQLDNAQPIPVLRLLKCLADSVFLPNIMCPCGSGKRFGDCHYQKIEELRPHYTPREFEVELKEIIKYERRRGVSLPLSQVESKRMQKQRRRKQRKR